MELYVILSRVTLAVPLKVVEDEVIVVKLPEIDVDTRLDAYEAKDVLDCGMNE